jgi:ribose/xylose/arabinose/galactoside ABC-type transport system permease subunit
MMLYDTPEKRPRREMLNRFFGGRFVLSVVIFALYLALIYAYQPTFFSPSNLASLLYYTCLLIPAALGVHLLIVLGLFDLSIGSVAAASGVVMAQAVAAGAPLSIGVIGGVVTGMLFGFLNWFLVSKLRIAALIGTLIAMGLARATAVGITQGETLAGLPEAFGRLSLGSFMGFPHAVAVGVILVAVLELLSLKHVIFRRFYQAGSNRRAAVDNGINVSALECLAFVLAGIGASLVGLLQSSRTLSATPHAFPDLALDCIAACVIGGDSLSGGSGRPTGAFLGMLMIVASRNLAVLGGVSVYWQDLAVSVILLAAVLFNKSSKADD